MILSPEQVARQYPEIAAKKAALPTSALLARAVLGGVLLSLAVFGALAVGALLPDAGTAKLVMALLFPSGLTMIVLAGGELFTGNAMLPLAAAKGSISARAVGRNWLLVFAGNAVGSLAVAALVAFIRRDDAAFVAVALQTAQAKAALTLGNTFARAVLCNILVCAAVWMGYAAQSAAGKIAAMYFPVMLFVLCGLEHCVTNMFYFPVALFLGGAPALSWGGFLLRNLLPSTLGNLVGGGAALGLGLWVGLFLDKLSR